MPRIHPSSYVDPQARLAESVFVGPNCHIVGEITLGDDCRLLTNVYLRGPMTVGRANVFYPNTCIGLAPQDRGFDPNTDGAGTVIGDNNIFREGVTVSRATGEKPTRVGSDCYLMANCHVGHDSSVGDHCTIANNSLLAGHVHVGDHVMLGGNSGIHQFCRVGRLAMLAGGATLKQDLPPFCTLFDTRQMGGLNLVGLRRAGLREHVKALRRAYVLLFDSGLTTPNALTKIREQFRDDALVAEMVGFLDGSKRGVPRGRRRSGDAAGD